MATRKYPTIFWPTHSPSHELLPNPLVDLKSILKIAANATVRSARTMYYAWSILVRVCLYSLLVIVSSLEAVYMYCSHSSHDEVW